MKQGNSTGNELRRQTKLSLPQEQAKAKIFREFRNQVDGDNIQDWMLV